MPATSTSTRTTTDFVRVLSLPAGEKRNAGLNELACRYHGRLELYVRCELQSIRWTGHLDPQDLVQSLYLKLMTVEPQDQISDEKHLVNWLRLVLRNHVLEQAKALKARKRDVSRVKSLPDDAPPEAGARPVGGNDDQRPGVSPRNAPPPAEAQRNEDFGRLRDFLRRAEEYLPAADWDLFRRHHLEGVPQSEIAAERGRTPGAVCQRLKRICATLAARFPNYADVLGEC
jgi:RNA polymerase sigma factor (sigma-70 family)